ncbi:M50 family peptidase [Macrococcus hajekii]|uniref:M50 family peptidase n=1 Tax=Macrococcus hajekii TaxID=198482 RepID=A0A4R6BJS0_9STAP|nr:M50 family metallopeptidase [Macrococcus hajekii]TDM01887.1 M50 family peptidase [Macrococcus hajekii]GGB08286.1 membrane protein [Macrococcus hajekii]
MLDFLISPITINMPFIIIIAAFYVLINIRFHHHFLLRWIHFIPILLHEFGHAIFCQLTGGHVKDIVVVTSRRERNMTERTGFAITATRGKFNQFMTLIGGYLFPPIILLISILCINYRYPVIFWFILMLIFIYYLFKTSRKWLPFAILIIILTFSYFMWRQPAYQYDLLNDFIYQLMIAVLLADTLLTSRTLTQVYFNGHPGWDGAALSRLTRIPAFIYYFFFIIVNIGSLYLALWLLF